MSHEVQTAWYAAKPAWHGLGVVTKEAKTSADVIKLAGMDWRVEQLPVLFGKPDCTGTYCRVPGYLVNTRSDNLLPLAVVTDSYRPVQNSDAFQFMDSLVEGGELLYESAGVLKNGRVVWVLARQPAGFAILPGDEQERYWLFSNSHDGSAGVRVRPTAVRVVCWNTLSLALGKAGRQFVAYHRGDVKRRINEAREILGLGDAHFLTYQERATFLLAQTASDKDVATYFKLVCPDPEIAPDVEARARTLEARRKTRTLMMEAFHNDPVRGARGTAWAAFNAVTAWADHGMRHTGRTARAVAENQMASVFMGAGATLKDRALHHALAFFDNTTGG